MFCKKWGRLPQPGWAEYLGTAKRGAEYLALPPRFGTESWVNTDPRKSTPVKLVLNAYSDGLFDFYIHRGDVRVAVSSVCLSLSLSVLLR